MFFSFVGEGQIDKLDKLAGDTLAHNLKLVRTMKTDAVSFTTDKLGQLYLVDEENSLTKFSPEGKFLFDYYNNTLGNLAFVDASNPFNLLLFFSDYLTIVTLDRTLSETGYFVLTDLEISDVSAVGISTDNNIWLFDNISYELKKLDHNGRLLLKSIQLSDLFQSSSLPTKIIENNRIVYMNVPDQGIMLFDDYGLYLSTIPIEGVRDLAISGSEILMLAGQQLYSYNLVSKQQTEVVLPTILKGESLVALQKNLLYILQEGKLEVYKPGG